MGTCSSITAINILITFFFFYLNHGIIINTLITKTYSGKKMHLGNRGFQTVSGENPQHCTFLYVLHTEHPAQILYFLVLNKKISEK